MVLVISIWDLTEYYKIPKEAIRLISNEEIEINKNTKILISDIRDVSYRRASTKGTQYKWGSVTICSFSNKYKIKYLSNCEDVAKEITSLIYKRQKEQDINY